MSALRSAVLHTRISPLAEITLEHGEHVGYPVVDERRLKSFKRPVK
jgi:hypothetical protein